MNAAPFHGTIFIDPDIVTPEDYSTFINLSYNGRAERIMFDRRVADWITSTPYLFPANYDDSIQIEIQVNPEFGDLASAKLQAEKFAPVIGQLSTELRKDVQTVWIHRGNYPFGGGNNNKQYGGWTGVKTGYLKITNEATLPVSGALSPFAGTPFSVGIFFTNMCFAPFTKIPKVIEIQDAKVGASFTTASKFMFGFA